MSDCMMLGLVLGCLLVLGVSIYRHYKGDDEIEVEKDDKTD